MKARALSLLLGLTLAGVWIASACLVDRKSDLLACTVQTDCASGRVCESGFCVVDENACPSECKSCDMSVTPHICVLDGNNGASFTCPKNVHCDITCASADACNNITCATGSSCTIVCSAGSACNDITCSGKSCNVMCTVANACDNVTCGGGDNGSCAIACTADGACNSVHCPSACSCAVTCGTATACGGISCPKGQGNKYCTASQNDGEPCITTAPNCDQC